MGWEGAGKDGGAVGFRMAVKLAAVTNAGPDGEMEVPVAGLAALASSGVILCQGEVAVRLKSATRSR